MRVLSLASTLAACVVVSAFGLVAVKHLSKAEKEALRRRKRDEDQAKDEEEEVNTEELGATPSGKHPRGDNTGALHDGAGSDSDTTAAPGSARKVGAAAAAATGAVVAVPPAAAAAAPVARTAGVSNAYLQLLSGNNMAPAPVPQVRRSLNTAFAAAATRAGVAHPITHGRLQYWAQCVLIYAAGRPCFYIVAQVHPVMGDLGVALVENLGDDKCSGPLHQDLVSDENKTVFVSALASRYFAQPPAGAIQPMGCAVMTLSPKECGNFAAAITGATASQLVLCPQPDGTTITGIERMAHLGAHVAPPARDVGEMMMRAWTEASHLFDAPVAGLEANSWCILDNATFTTRTKAIFTKKDENTSDGARLEGQLVRCTQLPLAVEGLRQNFPKGKVPSYGNEFIALAPVNEVFVHIYVNVMPFESSTHYSVFNTDVQRIRAGGVGGTTTITFSKLVAFVVRDSASKRLILKGFTHPDLSAITISTAIVRGAAAPADAPRRSATF